MKAAYSAVAAFALGLATLASGMHADEARKPMKNVTASRLPARTKAGNFLADWIAGGIVVGIEHTG